MKLHGRQSDNGSIARVTLKTINKTCQTKLAILLDKYPEQLHKLILIIIFFSNLFSIR